MMLRLRKGRYLVRLAENAGDRQRVMALRGLVFRGDAAAADGDAFDARCRHLMVEDAASGDLLACLRLLSGPMAEIGASYSAGFYDLGALARQPGRFAEIGRFCTRPRLGPGPRPADPDILRAVWGALTGLVDAEGVTMLTGCASFAGTDPAPYAQAFSLLARRHLAPEVWRPARRAAETVALPPGDQPASASLAQLPPLLRFYLSIGGKVSDHAVVDRDLGTLHVFCGLEVGAVPVRRAQALRALGAD